MTNYTANPGDDIKVMVDALVSGDILTLNPGTYDSLPFVLKSGTSLIGAPGLVQLYINPVAYGAAQVDVNYKSNVLIENIKFFAGGNNIFMRGASFITVRGCTFEHDQASGATCLNLTVGANNIKIENCTFDGGAYNSINISASTVPQPHTIDIINCTFMNNTIHGSIDFNGNVSDINIYNAICKNVLSGLAYSHDDAGRGHAQRVHFRDCTVTDCGQGIYMDSGFSNSTVENCLIIRSDTYSRPLYIDSPTATPSLNNQYLNNCICGQITILGQAVLSGNNFTSTQQTITGSACTCTDSTTPPPPPPPPPSMVNIIARSDGLGQVMWNDDPTQTSYAAYAIEMLPGTPWKLTAIPNEGYRFDTWTSGTQVYTSTSITGIAEVNAEYFAHFILIDVPPPPPPPPPPNEEVPTDWAKLAAQAGIAYVAIGVIRDILKSKR